MIERPPTVPAEGLVAPFDAGWNARELGFDRKTVEVLSPDPGWALLGWDTLDLLLKNAEQLCSECNRDLHGYRGPRCRYCDGTAE